MIEGLLKILGIFFQGESYLQYLSNKSYHFYFSRLRTANDKVSTFDHWIFCDTMERPEAVYRLINKIVHFVFILEDVNNIFVIIILISGFFTIPKVFWLVQKKGLLCTFHTL